MQNVTAWLQVATSLRQLRVALVDFVCVAKPIIKFHLFLSALPDLLILLLDALISTLKGCLKLFGSRESLLLLESERLS